jgi:hypothetical protein
MTKQRNRNPCSQNSNTKSPLQLPLKPASPASE